MIDFIHFQPDDRCAMSVAMATNLNEMFALLDAVSMH